MIEDEDVRIAKCMECGAAALLPPPNANKNGLSTWSQEINSIARAGLALAGYQPDQIERLLNKRVPEFDKEASGRPTWMPDIACGDNAAKQYIDIIRPLPSPPSPTPTTPPTALEEEVARESYCRAMELNPGSEVVDLIPQANQIFESDPRVNPERREVAMGHVFAELIQGTWRIALCGTMARAPRSVRGNRMRLQTGEFIYEQPATVDLEYTFKHAPTQEVAYNWVLIERRKHLHERAGRALESMFAYQLEEHVTELAHHYSRSADVMKALHYLRRAGQQAVQLSANTEAIRDFETALQLLHTLPNGTERLQEELALRLALAVPVMIVEGQSSRRVEETYARARELCQQLGDTSAVSLVLWGLYTAYVFGAEHRNARNIAGELRRLGDEARSSEILVWAHYALGVSSFWLGEFLPAIDHLQHGLDLYDSRLHHSYTLRYGQDPGVGCLAVMAIATWLSGFPDQALKVTERGLILANELSHPFSTGGMLWSTAWVRRLRGESIISQNLAETAISLCAQYRMPFSSTVNIMNGGALVAQGRARRNQAHSRGA